MIRTAGIIHEARSGSYSRPIPKLWGRRRSDLERALLAALQADRRKGEALAIPDGDNSRTRWEASGARLPGRTVVVAPRYAPRRSPGEHIRAGIAEDPDRRLARQASGELPGRPFVGRVVDTSRIVPGEQGI